MLSDNLNLEVGNAPVSVIIPCYRCSHFIERAVKSVINQKLQPSELILVDDFSDDDFLTKKKLLSLSQLPLPFQIKIIECSRNMGPGTARNIGWNSASHPYIAFLDADDSWHPEKILLQYSIMKNNPDCSISAHKSSVLKEEGISGVDSIKDPKIISVSIRQLLFRNLFPTRSVMLKTEINHRFVNGKKYSEDYLLWLEILGNLNKAVFIEASLAFSYKNDYGAAGLNGNLIKSEIGELHTLFTIYCKGYVGIAMYLLCSIFSMIKFFRRILIVFMQKK